LHRQLCPAAPVERLLFELLEQVRVESQVPTGLGGVAAPDQIGRSGGGEALGLTPLPIGTGGRNRRAGSAAEQRRCWRTNGRSSEGNAPLGLPIAEAWTGGAVGAKAIRPAPRRERRTGVIAAGSSVGRATPLGRTTIRSPAAFPIPAAVGGPVTTGLESLAVAGGIGPALAAWTLGTTGAGLSTETASLPVTVTVATGLRPRRTGAGRPAAGPAEGSVGGRSPGAATGTAVGGAVPTALGTAAGTAIWGLAHGVRGDGLGESVFARWSRSSASRRGFRKKSHPTMVSNPVACP
jgi:hypothetical protein